VSVIGCSGWLIDFARSLLGLSECLLGMARWLLDILTGIYWVDPIGVFRVVAYCGKPKEPFPKSLE